MTSTPTNLDTSNQANKDADMSLRERVNLYIGATIPVVMDVISKGCISGLLVFPGLFPLFLWLNKFGRKHSIDAPYLEVRQKAPFFFIARKKTELNKFNLVVGIPLTYLWYHLGVVIGGILSVTAAAILLPFVVAAAVLVTAADKIKHFFAGLKNAAHQSNLSDTQQTVSEPTTVPQAYAAVSQLPQVTATPAAQPVPDNTEPNETVKIDITSAVSQPQITPQDPGVVAQSMSI